MKILYIHGFNGSSDGPKPETLRENFKEAEIIAPQHDSRAGNAFQLLDKSARMLDAVDDVIVGSSLGGFWANFFSLKYGVGAVLVNPAIRPSQSLAELGFPLASEYLEFENQVSSVEISPRSVLLAKDDEVLDYRQAYEYFSPRCQVELTPTGGHRMNGPESLERIRQLVEKMLFRAPCWEISNDDDD